MNAGSQKGVTLVEAALVLAVLGVILTLGVTSLAPVLRGHDREATGHTLTSVRDALVGFANVNHRLPRISSGGTGVEGDFDVPAAFEAVGELPNSTIGCSRGDAYGYVLSYDVDNDYTDVDAGPGLPESDFWDELAFRGSSSTYSYVAPLVIVDNGSPFDAAFVVVSPGPNGVLDCYSEGPPLTKFRYYQVYETMRPEDDPSFPIAGYDDVVSYVTPAQLYSETGGP